MFDGSLLCLPFFFLSCVRAGSSLALPLHLFPVLTPVLIFVLLPLFLLRSSCFGVVRWCGLLVWFGSVGLILVWFYLSACDTCVACLVGRSIGSLVTLVERANNPPHRATNPAAAGILRTKSYYFSALVMSSGFRASSGYI